METSIKYKSWLMNLKCRSMDAKPIFSIYYLLLNYAHDLIIIIPHLYGKDDWC